MKAVNPNPIFYAFANLPLELREQIWRDALPERPNPTLFPYIEGSWVLSSYLPGDEDYIELHSEDNNTAKFTTRLVPNVPVATPLLDVSREARRIAIAWARNTGYNIEPRRKGDPPTTTNHNNGNDNNRHFEMPAGALTITRPIDPAIDAIYFATEEAINRFFNEPWEIRSGHGSWRFDSPLTTVALPQALLEAKDTAFYFQLSLSQYYWRLLYAVLNPQPDDVGPAGTWWELQDDAVHGPGSFVWNDTDRAFVQHPKSGGGDGSEVNEKLQTMVDNVALELAAIKDQAGVANNFELRLAYAVKQT